MFYSITISILFGVQIVLVGTYSNCLLSLFDRVLIVVGNFILFCFTFGTPRCSRIFLTHFFLTPGISHFSKKPWIVLVGNAI